MIGKIIHIPEKETFIYFNDSNNDKFYVPRNIYDVANHLKLDFTATPRIIGDRNYYAIPKEAIKEIEARSNYVGIEKVMRFPNDTPNFDLVNTIFVYRDGRTGLIYIPEKFAIATQTGGNTKTILEDKCYRISEREVEKILNKRIIVLTVYPKPDVTETITICKAPDRLFIEESVGIKHGLALEGRKKIRVDGVMYVQVSDAEITLIKIISSKEDIQVEFVEKNIVPKKR